MEEQARIKSELLKAKALIKAQKYKEAQAILIKVNHPTAVNWLNKINKILTDAPTDSTPISIPTPVNREINQVPEKTFIPYLALAIFALFFMFLPGVIVTFILASEAEKYPAAPGANGLLRLRRFFQILTVPPLILFSIPFLLAFVGSYFEAILNLHFFHYMQFNQMIALLASSIALAIIAFIKWDQKLSKFIFYIYLFGFLYLAFLFIQKNIISVLRINRLDNFFNFITFRSYFQDLSGYFSNNVVYFGQPRLDLFLVFIIGGYSLWLLGLTFILSYKLAQRNVTN